MPPFRHRHVFALLVAIAGALLAPALAAQPNPARPNVVLIITDDMGWADLGSYGAPDVQTPNIDRLAREGLRFTDFYANAVLCSPTRAGLITGRYQQRYGVEMALSSAGSTGGVTRGLTASSGSLPRLLKTAGYATALVGKWHLGYTTDLITAKAIDWIGRHADGPFFIDVAYNAPHWPYQRPDVPSVARQNARALGPADSATSSRADYVAMVERVDQGVGAIIAEL